jgi:choice-of-anchor C domain-containing protein
MNLSWDRAALIAGPSVNAVTYVTTSPSPLLAPPWVVTRQNIDIVDSYWPAAHGKRSIDLHDSPGLGGLAQTFDTTPGQSYLDMCSYDGNPEDETHTKVFAVSAAGMSAQFTFDTTGKSRHKMDWKKATWRFMAIEKKPTLETHTMVSNDDVTGPVVDDVGVIEVR